MFADDTCLIYVHDDLDALVLHVNEKLSLVLEWFRITKLSLDPNKSEFIIIMHNLIVLFPILYQGYNPIKRVEP